MLIVPHRVVLLNLAGLSDPFENMTKPWIPPLRENELERSEEVGAGREPLHLGEPSPWSLYSCLVMLFRGHSFRSFGDFFLFLKCVRSGVCIRN